MSFIINIQHVAILMIKRQITIIKGVMILMRKRGMTK